MLNEDVKSLLKAQMWDIATVSEAGEPNVVPVAFKDVAEDGTLLVGDVFLATTLANVQANGKVAVSVYDPANLTGYQIKGTTSYITEGEVVDAFKAAVESMFNGAATAKGALLITPERVIVTTPGADNKKEL